MRSAWDIVQQGMGIISDVAWKIDNAEANQQYLQGTEFLRKATTDFNNSLATDPNPEGYLDKWNKQKDMLWRQAQGLVKNPRALEALTRDWAAMDEKQYADITGAQTKARIDQITLKTGNTIQGIVNDNSRSNGDRKQAVAKALLPLIQIGQLKPEAALAEEQRLGKVIDSNAMQEGLTQVARTQGWDYALGLVDNPEFNHFFPALDQNDRNAILSKMESQVRFDQAQAQKADEAQNADYADRMDQAFENLQQGKEGGLSFNMIGNPQGFSNTVVGERYRRTFDTMLRTWMHEQEVLGRQSASERRANQRTAEAEANADAMGIITSEDSLASKAQQLRELGANRGIDQKMIASWIKQSRTAGNNTSFNSIMRRVAALGQGKSPVLTKEQVQEIGGVLWRLTENDPKITMGKLENELEPLLDNAKKKNVQPVIDRLLAFQALLPEERQMAELPGNYQQILKEAPGMGTPGQVTNYFASHGLSIEKSGLDSRGTPYWHGSDGRYYIVAAGKLMTLSQDGKSWVMP